MKEIYRCETDRYTIAANTYLEERGKYNTVFHFIDEKFTII